MVLFVLPEHLHEPLEFALQDSDTEEVADSDEEDEGGAAMLLDAQETAGSLAQLLSDSERFGALHCISQALRQLHLQVS